MKTIILIPPSEGKNAGGTGAPLKKVSSTTDVLLKKLKTAPDSIYGLKEKALANAKATNKKVLTSPTMPAIERYKGVVYQGFDYVTLTTKEKSYANEQIKIVSGLFGIVNLQDPLPDYKLAINKLGADKLWREQNVFKDVFVIDLLPGAHRKAVHYDEGVMIDFFIMKKEKRMPAGHAGKHIKGRFVRWLIKNKNLDYTNFSEDDFHWTGTCFEKEIA